MGHLYLLDLEHPEVKVALAVCTRSAPKPGAPLVLIGNSTRFVQAKCRDDPRRDGALDTFAIEEGTPAQFWLKRGFPETGPYDTYGLSLGAQQAIPSSLILRRDCAGIQEYKEGSRQGS